VKAVNPVARARTSCALAGFSLLIAACGAPPPDAVEKTGNNAQSAGFQAFRSSVIRLPTGEFLVEGDMALSERQLEAYYDNRYGISNALVQASTNGFLSRWTADAQLDLSYCVSDGFGSSKAAVLRAVGKAVGAWSTGTYLRFRYDSTAGGDCLLQSKRTRIVVSPNPFSYGCLVGGTPIYESAPFVCPDGTMSLAVPSSTYPPPDPQDPTSTAGIAVSDNILHDSAVDLQMVLDHEFGHALGFDHEDRQLNCGSVNFDPASVPITAPDPLSIMVSNCAVTKNTTLSAKDHEGVGLIYGYSVPARETFDVNGPVFPGTMAYSHFIGTGDRNFTVTGWISGTNDGDIYVGYGFPPTTSHYSAFQPVSTQLSSFTLVPPIGPFGLDVFLGVYARGGGIAGGSVQVDFNRLTNPNVLLPFASSSIAAFDPTLRAPACSTTGTTCATSTLVAGRGAIAGGPEANAPKTTDGCADGNYGTYLSDESVEAVTIRTLDGLPLRSGGTAEVDVDLFAWSTSQDFLSLYYKANSDDSWRYVGTALPESTGRSTVAIPVPLDAGGPTQTVRAVFRYNPSGAAPSPCPGGIFDDVDDLAFRVAPVFTQ
jgi:hypothetical protein